MEVAVVGVALAWTTTEVVLEGTTATRDVWAADREVRTETEEVRQLRLAQTIATIIITTETTAVRPTTAVQTLTVANELNNPLDFV